MTAKKENDVPKTFNDAQDDTLLDSALVSEENRLPQEDMSHLKKEIETLNSALQVAKDKADAHWERLLRKEAEFQNAERRYAADLEKTRKFAIERFAQELLSVLDSFDQGLTFAKEGNVEVNYLIEGVELTRNVLMNALEKQGIAEINPVGTAFDPNFHEALSMQESAEVPPNQILVVVQKGYILDNRLLRPARVIVSKKPAE